MNIKTFLIVQSSHNPQSSEQKLKYVKEYGMLQN